MKSISRQLRELFERWRKNLGSDAKDFVADGLIAEDDMPWLGAPARVLFLLKEANNRNDVLQACNFDLPLLFRDSNRFGQNKKTVERRMAQWACDLWCFHQSARPTLDDALRSSAVMYLKKQAGTATANTSDLRRAALRDATHIMEEISILAPDVVVCGGTFQHVRRIYPTMERIPETEFCYIGGGVIWIDHYHPAAWAGLKDRHSAILKEYDLLSLSARASTTATTEVLPAF